MDEEQHSQTGAVLTELVLEVFRLNGRLLAAGDRLISPLGLSSARWQVMGAINLTEEPQTVSCLARNMGLSRQAVQRIVNELQGDGMVAFKANPAHKRAQLVTLTRKGHAAYAAADRRQKPWVNRLAKQIDGREVKSALTVLTQIRTQLEASEVS